MEINRVTVLYWSPTGNTRRIAAAVAAPLAEALGCPLETVDLTLPAARGRLRSFGRGDLAVVATPTYAGRVPNKLAPSLAADLQGGGALAVGVVTFGNRSYDNSLAELCAILEADGFHTVAAGAFACRHAFTDELAWGRPNREDLEDAAALAAKTAERVRALSSPPSPLSVPGDPAAPYYVPRGTDGAPAVFLKAKPKTDLSRCNQCGVCARICPMGSIDPRDASLVPGICIKCQACVRRCTKHAKYFDDPAFLSHVAMLERDFTAPKKNELFW